MRNLITFAIILAVELVTAAATAQSLAGASQSMELDLAKPFHTRSAWRFVVTEGPPVKSFDDSDVPGVLTLCLYKSSKDSCQSDAVTLSPRTTRPNYIIWWEPHYLITVKVVYPQGPKAAPLLLVVTGSMYSGDGDQIVSTQLITYDVDRDAFRRVYGKSVGHNNNQEVRFVTDGPLQGSIISVEPQMHPPYGYWIVISKYVPAKGYRQVLRYGSATHYNDGNSLAVIDSEMPNIEKLLGLWKLGDPIPIPNREVDNKSCLKPILRHNELWCS